MVKICFPRNRSFGFLNFSVKMAGQTKVGKIDILGQFILAQPMAIMNIFSLRFLNILTNGADK